MPEPSAKGEKRRRDQRAERLRALRALQSRGHHPIDPLIRRNLAAWSQPVDGQPRLDEIRLRPGFIRRTHALTAEELDGHNLIDRPKPKLPRQPPLAWLTRLPRGVGQRTALTVPFLVQTRPGTLGADGLLNIPVEAIDEPFGLIDLIAVNAIHKPRLDSTFASSAKENRKRQIREALKHLAAPDLQMVQLPISGRGQPRFGDVHLNREEGAYGIDEPPRYRSPKMVTAVTIPTAFFLNGWIHALTNREIAMWLMLRDLTVRANRHTDSAADTAATPDVQISAKTRLREYDLSLATWRSHLELEAFGLIHVERDPNRRENGTTIDGKRAAPHRFRLLDEGLDESPAIDRVIKALEDPGGPGQG